MTKFVALLKTRAPLYKIGEVGGRNNIGGK